MSKLRAIIRSLQKRLLLPVSIVIGVTVLPTAGVLSFLLSTRGNDWIRQHLESYLSNKLHTKVTIGSVYLRSLNHVRISDFRLLDRDGVTLISLQTFSLKLRWSYFWKSSQPLFHEIYISNLIGKIYREPDSSIFNYQFILDAFTSSEKQATTRRSDISWLVPDLVELQNVSLKYSDSKSGDSASVDFTRLSAKVDLVDEVIPAKWIFKNILLDEAALTVILGKNSPSETRNATDGTTSLKNRIEVNSFQAVNTLFHYTDKKNRLVVKSKSDCLLVRNADLAFANQRIHVNRIEISDHFTSILSNPVKTQNDLSEESPIPSIAIDTLLINDTRFLVDLANHKKNKKSEFDPYHNDYQDVSVVATQLAYRSDGVSGKLRNLSLTDAQNFRLRSFGADFSIKDSLLRINRLNILTNNNSLKGSILWKYQSLQKAIADPEKTRFDVLAKADKLNLKELAYFLPILLRYNSIYPLYKQNINLETRATGSFRDIKLGRLTITTPHNRIVGSGEIHVPKHAGAWVALDIRQAQTGKQGILDVVSPAILSSELLARIPAKVAINGSMQIRENGLSGKLNFNSNLGNLYVNGKLSNFSSLEKASYDLSFKTRRFQLGKILQDTLIGIITAHGHVRGKGLVDVNKMSLSAAGFVDNLTIAQRQVRSVLFQSSLLGGTLRSYLASSNPDLNFELSPVLQFSKKDSLVSLYGVVYNADLRKLGLLNDSLNVSGWILADVAHFEKDGIVGKLKMSSTQIGLNGKTYKIDSLTLEADQTNDQQNVQLTSSLADLKLSGKFAYNRIPDFARGLYQSIVKNTAYPDPNDIAFFSLSGDVHIKEDNLALIPSLARLAPFSFRSSYNSNEGTFDFQTKIDSLTLNGIALDSLESELSLRRDTVNALPRTSYLVAVKNITSGSIKLPRILLKGEATEGIHSGILVSRTRSSENLFQVPFRYDTRLTNPYLTFPSALIFKGEAWDVNTNNALFLTAPHFAGSYIQLQNGAKLLKFSAGSADSNGLPYQLQLDDIDLSPLTALLKADSSFLKGSVDGSISVNELQPLALTARVTIDDLELKGTPMGRLAAEIRNESNGQYQLKANLDHAGHQFVNASGTYNPAKGTGVVAVKVDSLSLVPLNNFLDGEVDSLQGALGGLVTIKIDTTNTSFNGRLSIDSSALGIPVTGTHIKVVQGGLAFKGNKIELDNIVLTDGLKGQGKITGSVDFTDKRDLHYKLKLDAKKFKTINELQKREQIIYGSGKTDVNLDMSGNLKQFRLTGGVELNDSSEVYYRSKVITKPSFGEGLLEFATPQNLEKEENAYEAKLISKLINTNISVSPSTTLNLILDEYKGEKVVVRGKSNLNYSQHAGGEMQLNGKYEVTSGNYTLIVGNNIKREFALESGGTIQWLGNVYEPICDLTAVYKVTASVSTLMQGTSTSEEIGRRKFDFLVKLKLKGSLTKPEISFELGMNEKDQDAFDGTVYSKIKEINNSPSDVTKQVMSLLVLNAFMGDSPFGSLTQFSNTGLEAGAYNTIGNMLTQQLNTLLAGMIKTVDITLGVDWSESVDGGRSSTRSDIRLGLGKSLFDHRLNLYVGNNFGVETASGKNSGISGLANDVSIEYLLTPDGKYRIKGYHVRDNELTLHGEHMETGVKFTIVWEFDLHDLKTTRTRKKKDIQ